MLCALLTSVLQARRWTYPWVSRHSIRYCNSSNPTLVVSVNFADCYNSDTVDGLANVQTSRSNVCLLVYIVFLVKPYKFLSEGLVDTNVTENAFTIHTYAMLAWHVCCTVVFSQAKGFCRPLKIDGYRVVL